jgi:hypothetical protein
MFKAILTLVIAFIAGFGLPLLLRPLMPPPEASFSYAAIAASFVLNLACLSLALVGSPREAARGRFPHLLAWLLCSAASLFAYAGLWAAPVHRESWHVFAALAFLTSAQAAALLALHASTQLVVGRDARATRVLCVTTLTVLTCALWFTREPILRLSKSGGEGSQPASHLSDAVMNFSPPAAVAAAWYHESDSARPQTTAAARRFDLVHGPLTYAVWIGSYQTALTPEIMFSGGGDFYSHKEFSPGLALTLLAWALPLLALCDVLLRIEQTNQSPRGIVTTLQPSDC